MPTNPMPKAIKKKTNSVMMSSTKSSDLNFYDSIIKTYWILPHMLTSHPQHPRNVTVIQPHDHVVTKKILRYSVKEIN